MVSAYGAKVKRTYGNLLTPNTTQAVEVAVIFPLEVTAEVKVGGVTVGNVKANSTNMPETQTYLVKAGGTLEVQKSGSPGGTEYETSYATVEGSAGKEGKTGATGPEGKTGPQGTQGVKGETGSTGLEGKITASSYGAEEPRQVNTEYEASATLPVQVILTVASNNITAFSCKVRVGSLYVTNVKLPGNLSTAPSIPVTFIVPTKEKWAVEGCEKSFVTLTTSYLPL